MQIATSSSLSLPPVASLLYFHLLPFDLSLLPLLYALCSVPLRQATVKFLLLPAACCVLPTGMCVSVVKAVLFVVIW